MEGIFKNLALDRWYKVSLTVGFALVVLALTVDTRWLTNKQAGLMGMGFLLIGFGAWKNVKWKVEFTHRPAGYMKYQVVAPDPAGVTLWTAGIGCFCWLLKRTSRLIRAATTICIVDIAENPVHKLPWTPIAQ